MGERDFFVIFLGYFWVIFLLYGEGFYCNSPILLPLFHKLRHVLHLRRSPKNRILPMHEIKRLNPRDTRPRLRHPIDRQQ